MATPAWLWPAVAAVFGALWGSFLNVVIVRVPRDESIVRPASHCVACGAKIRPWDNIPIVSFLLLRGRCRACGARFSIRYPIVEALGAIAGWGCVTLFGPGLAAAGFFVFCLLLVAIAFIDAENWIIPHELSWPGIAAGLAFSFANPRARPVDAALGAALAWAGFTLMSWFGEKIFKKEALGLGDRWLLAVVGAFLGYGALLPVVFLSSFQGAIVGLVLIALGKGQTGERPDVESATGEEGADPDDWIPPKHALPFGPFLSLAGIEWLFFGPSLAQGYARIVARMVAR